MNSPQFLNKVPQALGDPNLSNQIITSVVMGVIFMLASYLFKDFYYRYWDETEYVHISSPISVDRPYYKPGDLVGISAGIKVETDIQAVVLTELVLAQTNDGNYTRIEGTQIVQSSPFRKAEFHIVTTYLKLPDQLNEGQYYWKGNACYEIRGYDKCESYISETFFVTQSGLSPRTDEALEVLK